MPYLAHTGFGPSVNMCPTPGFYSSMLPREQRLRFAEEPTERHDPSWCRHPQNATFWSIKPNQEAHQEFNAVAPGKMTRLDPPSILGPATCGWRPVVRTERQDLFRLAAPCQPLSSRDLVCA
jgi:hypothetical protein